MPVFADLIKDLPVFKCEPHYYAPDGSDIRLGPQYGIMPGNIASATFQPKSASQAVVHSYEAPIAIAEKWFYLKADDLPNFYLWMNDEIYEITPGTKIEMPVGTRFQIFNPSEKPVPVLMITYPYWPQDERAGMLTAPVEGSWKSTDFGNRAPQHHTYLDKEGILDLSRKDPFFVEGMSGDDYVRVSLASVGQNPDDYKIAGKTWTSYAEKLKGLTQAESDKEVLEITPTDIPNEMQSQRIFALSEEEKTRVINMQRSPSPAISGTSVERTSPIYTGIE